MASKFGKHNIPSEPTIYNNEEFRIVLVGKTGVGKSATGNTILGGEKFESEFSFNSVTVNCGKACGEVDGQKIAVIDTPGLFDTNIDEETTMKNVGKSILYASPGPHIFLIVIQLSRFTEEEKKTVQNIQKIFGDKADKYSMILFTHGDQLEKKTIEKCLEESKYVKELVAKCNGQYHVFDNKLKDHSQVGELLSKIRQITEMNGGSHYTNEVFQKTEKAIQAEKQQILREKEQQMRKEREELKKKLEGILKKQLSEAKADKKKENQLKAAHEITMQVEIDKLKEEQEVKARKEAENSSKLLKNILLIVTPLLGVVASIMFKVMR